jgi:hypothetical protein
MATPQPSNAALDRIFAQLRSKCELQIPEIYQRLFANRHDEARIKAAHTLRQTLEAAHRGERFHLPAPAAGVLTRLQSTRLANL